MNCEIDYCTNTGERMVRLEVEGQTLKMDICKPHEQALLARLREQRRDESVVLADGFWGTCGELNDAIDYLDSVAASEQERGH